jgi:hypothetical protein
MYEAIYENAIRKLEQNAVGRMRRKRGTDLLHSIVIESI